MYVESRTPLPSESCAQTPKHPRHPEPPPEHLMTAFRNISASPLLDLHPGQGTNVLEFLERLNMEHGAEAPFDLQTLGIRLRDAEASPAPAGPATEHGGPREEKEPGSVSEETSGRLRRPEATLPSRPPGFWDTVRENIYGTVVTK